MGLDAVGFVRQLGVPVFPSRCLGLENTHLISFATFLVACHVSFVIAVSFSPRTQLCTLMFLS